MKTIQFLYLLCLLIKSALTSAQITDHVSIEIKDNWKMHRFGNNIWYPATVPGCVHTDLINNKVIPDPFYRDNEKKLQWIDKYSWEYATEFIVSKDISEKKNIFLHFKGLDTYADVYLNDQMILSADNMFIQWNVDVKNQIREGINTLRILFHSPIAVGMLKRDQWNIEAPIGFNLDFGPGISGLSASSDFPPVGPYTRKAGYMYGWDWAPWLTTSGIWRPVYLEAWDDGRITSLQIVQNSVAKEYADLSAYVDVQSSRPLQADLLLKYSIDGKETLIKSIPTTLVPGSNLIPVKFGIPQPRLWWPNGLGEHPLYKITALLKMNDLILDEISVYTGIRNARLVIEPDKYGKSFYFEINGVPVFAKGANYVPADIFPSRVTPEHYRKLIESAAAVNINMLRVWGGGIYESDLFYDLCDQYGIMVWQDFMFAIVFTPGHDDFLNNVKRELVDNISRLRNHPSIVLWCGNNETEVLWDLIYKRFFGIKSTLAETAGGISGWLNMIPQTPVKQETTEKVMKSYDDLFYKLIPEVLKEYDLNNRPYWPSSPIGGYKEPVNPFSGDFHYYIALSEAPFEDYYTSRSRFYSEHGIHSLPDFNTVKKFTESSDWDYLSPVMQYHNRAMGGNQLLDRYIKRYYRYPKDFESYLYVAQVMQADAMKIALESHRRSRPYTMGTLYWMLNDVWPAASWASLNYENHWKALHYQVRNSFRKILVVPQFNKDTFKLHIVSDSLKPFKATAEITIMNFDGKKLRDISLPVNVEANSSVMVLEKTAKEFLAGIDTANAVCKVRLLQNKKEITSNECLLAAPKNLNLPKANIERKIFPLKDGYSIELTTDKYARRVCLSTDHDGFFSDNYFDLTPGQVKKVHFKPEGEIIDFEKDLKVTSLRDSW